MNTSFIILEEKKSDYKFIEFLKLVESKGAGEILINSIDKDGSGNGFDIDLVKLTQKIPHCQLYAVVDRKI